MVTKQYKFLFVNYSGYPEYMEYLYLENGLPYLAALLKKRGQNCTILDYVTLSTAKRLFPYEYKEKVIQLRSEAIENIVKYNNIPLDIIKKIKEYNYLIDERNRKIVDDISREIISYIETNGIDCIGFKLWSQPSFIDQLYMAKKIRKRFPGLLIIGGGAPVDFFMGNIYEEAEDIFDFLVFGDGEIAVELIPQYLEGKIKIEGIPNIIYKKKGQIIINKEEKIKNFPKDVYMNFDSKVYHGINKQDEKVKLLPIENARGCNFKCGFCIHPIKSGYYREKDTQAFIEEIYCLKERYGFINFYGVGSNTSHENCIANLKKVYQRGNEVILSFFQSARDFDFNNSPFLKKANVGFFWIGIETASQKLAQESIINGKQISKSEQVCKLLKELGIRTYTSYIFPLPGSNEKSIEETQYMIKRLASEWLVIYPPMVQPRTAWFKGRNPYVQIVDSKAFIHSSMYGIEEMDNKILPRIITDDVMAESIRINGKNYREIYYDYIRFKNNNSNGGNPLIAHQYTMKTSNRRNHKVDQLYVLTDKMTQSVMKALSYGEFDDARKDLIKYNNFCTSGTVLKSN